MIVQLLCPERHCIVAGAFEEGRGSFDETCEMLKATMRQMKVNSQCGICGSRELQFEMGRTKWKTMIEAGPHLAENMMNQIKTRNVLDSLGATYDQQRKN